MTNLHNNGLRLDYGLEGISHRRKNLDDPDIWPEYQSLPPPSQTVKAQLTELLNSSDTSSFLRSALQPKLHNEGLLNPSYFNATLLNALQILRRASEDHSEHSRILKRAVHLLAEEVGLRELSNMYRSTLYQG